MRREGTSLRSIRQPEISLAEAYHVMQSFLVHIGAAPTDIEEPVDGVVEVGGGGVFSRLKFDKEPLSQGAVLSLLRASERTSGKRALFSVTGFTQSARAVCRARDVALFNIDANGEVLPISRSARGLMPEEHFTPPIRQDNRLPVLPDVGLTQARPQPEFKCRDCGSHDIEQLA